MAKGNTRRKINEVPLEEKTYQGKVTYFKKQFYEFAKKYATNEQKIDIFLEYIAKNVKLEDDTNKSVTYFAILLRNIDPKIPSLKTYFESGKKVKMSADEKKQFDYLYDIYQKYEKAKAASTDTPNDLWYNKKGSNFFFAMEFKKYCDRFNIPCEVLSGCREIKYEGELGQMTYVLGHRVNRVEYNGRQVIVDIEAMLKAKQEGKDYSEYRICSESAWKELNPDRELAPKGYSVFDDGDLKYYKWVENKQKQALKEDVKRYSERTKAKVA